jgi:hypothetical protein
MADTSNHNNLKLVPVLLQYFTPEKRVQIKEIEFHNLKDETADVLTTYTLNILYKYKLSHRVISFCGDNCNANFGGAARRGKKCFCQAKDQQFKNEDSLYRICRPYFA